MEKGGKVVKPDIQYFKRPGKDIKLFSPDVEKLQHLAVKLINGYLYLPDEQRNGNNVFRLMSWLFPADRSENKPWHIWYELGNFDGVLGFTDILKKYRADFVAFLWGKDVWGPDLARDIKTLVGRFMKDYGVRRLGFETADRRAARWARTLGFKQEGTKAIGFRHDGKDYTLTLLRKLYE